MGSTQKSTYISRKSFALTYFENFQQILCLSTVFYYSSCFKSWGFLETGLWWRACVKKDETKKMQKHWCSLILLLTLICSSNWSTSLHNAQWKRHTRQWLRSKTLKILTLKMLLLRKTGNKNGRCGKNSQFLTRYIKRVRSKRHTETIVTHQFI